MSYTSTLTASDTETYTMTDIETVMRRVTADLVMIATSSGALSEEEARKYSHDIEILAKNGYLKKVDITLLSAGIEVKATCYEINTSSGDLTMSRPGGVLWPKVQSPYLQIILCYNSDYSQEARLKMKNRLKISWVSANDIDISHKTLRAAAGRDYVSNGYGMQRKDFS